MEILNHRNNNRVESFHVKLSNIELYIIGNCLNEVCNGFEISNSELVLESSLEIMHKLLYKIRDIYYLSKANESSDQAVLLERRNLRSIYNAITATLEELNYPGEFRTRVGADREEAEVLLNDLRKINTELS